MKAQESIWEIPAIGLVALLCIVGVACGESKPAPTPTPAPEAASALIREVRSK